MPKAISIAKSRTSAHEATIPEYRLAIGGGPDRRTAKGLRAALAALPTYRGKTFDCRARPPRRNDGDGDRVLLLAGWARCTDHYPTARPAGGGRLVCNSVGALAVARGAGCADHRRSAKRRGLYVACALGGGSATWSDFASSCRRPSLTGGGRPTRCWKRPVTWWWWSDQFTGRR
jgi:hypothetical protein